MNTLRQIDDLRDINELEAQMDNALAVISEIEKELKLARNSIDRQDPFDLMLALAELNKLIVKKAMPIAIIAEAEAIKETKADAMRIA